MTECPNPDQPFTYSRRYAQRMADRAGIKTTVQRCGDHYHIAEDPDSLGRRIRGSLKGKLT